MDTRNKYLIKNMGVLTVSNFASKILIFLLVPLYTSILSTEEYGVYDLIITTVTLLCPILTANIVDAVMRFSMEQECDKKKVAAIGIRYISFSIAIIFVFLFIIDRLRIWKDVDGLEIYIGLYYSTYVLDQFFIQLAKGLERIAEMGIAGVLGTVTMLSMNVLFLLIFKWGLTGFFLANILAQAIPVIYFFMSLRAWEYFGSLKIDKALRNEMLAYCLPLIATNIGWWVNSASDRYVVTFLCGLAANGVLSVSYKIPSALNMIQSIFTQAWQISAIKEYNGRDTERFYGATFTLMNVVMSAACAWLIVLSKPLAGILYAKDFYVAYRYVPFLLISYVFNCAAGFMGPILGAKKDSKTMALSAIYGASVNLVLNIFLFWLMGVQGATIATAISSFIIYQVRRSSIKDQIKVERYGVVLATWSLLCFQAFVEIYTPFWYVEVILMAVMLWLNRMEMMKVLYRFFGRMDDRRANG